MVIEIASLAGIEPVRSLGAWISGDVLIANTLGMLTLLLDGLNLGGIFFKFVFHLCRPSKVTIPIRVA